MAWLSVLHLACPDPNTDYSQALSTNHVNTPFHGQLQGLCGVYEMKSRPLSPQHTGTAATTHELFVVNHVSHPRLHCDFMCLPPLNFPAAFAVAVWLVSAYEGMLHIGAHWSPLLYPGCWPHTLGICSFFTPMEAP